MIRAELQLSGSDLKSTEVNERVKLMPHELCCEDEKVVWPEC